jgi:hypothetical protein
MTFDWKEYFALAVFLENQAGAGFTVEATTRCAVSRAYYAAFCYARNYAEAKLGYVRLKGGQDHRGVREHYKKRGMYPIANKLGTLYRWRGDCDYEDEMIQEANLLATTFIHAQHILNLK